MTSGDIKEMIEYTNNWKLWLENIKERPEDTEGKMNLIKQMDQAIQKWQLELR